MAVNNKFIDAKDSQRLLAERRGSEASRKARSTGKAIQGQDLADYFHGVKPNAVETFVSRKKGRPEI